MLQCNKAPPASTYCPCGNLDYARSILITSSDQLVPLSHKVEPLPRCCVPKTHRYQQIIISAGEMIWRHHQINTRTLITALTKTREKEARNTYSVASRWWFVRYLEQIRKKILHDDQIIVHLNL